MFASYGSWAEDLSVYPMHFVQAPEVLFCLIRDYYHFRTRKLKHMDLVREESLQQSGFPAYFLLAPQK